MVLCTLSVMISNFQQRTEKSREDKEEKFWKPANNFR